MKIAWPFACGISDYTAIRRLGGRYRVRHLVGGRGSTVAEDGRWVNRLGPVGVTYNRPYSCLQSVPGLAVLNAPGSPHWHLPPILKAHRKGFVRSAPSMTTFTKSALPNGPEGGWRTALHSRRHPTLISVIKSTLSSLHQLSHFTGSLLAQLQRKAASAQS